MLFNLCVNILSFNVVLCKVYKITAIFFIARMSFRAGRSGPAALVVAAWTSFTQGKTTFNLTKSR